MFPDICRAAGLVNDVDTMFFGNVDGAAKTEKRPGRLDEKVMDDRFGQVGLLFLQGRLYFINALQCPSPPRTSNASRREGTTIRSFMREGRFSVERDQ